MILGLTVAGGPEALEKTIKPLIFISIQIFDHKTWLPLNPIENLLSHLQFYENKRNVLH